MKKQEYSFVVLIIFLGLISYANVYDNEFVWDDSFFVVNNEHIKSFNYTGAMFSESIGAGASRPSMFYRPMQQVVYALSYSLAGMSLSVFHFLNVFFHVGSAVLIFMLLKKISTTPISLVASMLWTVHPVQTESVTYISGLGGPMMVFFGILSFYLYLKWRERNEWYVLAGSVCLFLLALLSKEVIIVLPLLIAVYELIFTKREVKQLKGLLPHSMVIVLYLFIRTKYLKIPTPNVLTLKYNLVAGSKNFLLGLLEYYKILFFPADLHVKHSITFQGNSAIAASVIILMGVFLIARYFYNKKEYIVPFGCAWFYLSFIPTSGIIPVNSPFFEHWLYLPSIGFFMVVGYLVSRAYTRYRELTVALFVGVIVILVTATVHQNTIWKDSLTLYSHAVQYEPDSFLVNNNLGNAYLNAKDLDKAEIYLFKAYNISSNRYYNNYNLGRWYYHKKNINASIYFLNRSVVLNPSFPNGREWLAFVYSQWDLTREKTEFKT